ncbi:MAG: 50S ribosomal protein L9 [Acidobacteria bacterium]|nr:50S ribosomal protein L9 [Acidobacteriota bacterium]
MVELILRESIDHLGRRGDVVKVAGGYARNYLLPRKLALPVTEANRRQVDRERVIAEQREADERQAAQALADRVAAVECEIARRVGENDTLYGSVTNADIAEQLAVNMLEIDKRQVQLDEPIKQLGDFTVAVKIHRDVTTNVRVRVVSEGAAADESA